MKAVILLAALCLVFLTVCRSQEGLPAVRVSFEGGYSEIARGSYSLTPAADGASVEFRYEEEDLRGYSLKYGKTLPRAELEEVYRIFAENEIARLPSSDLVYATDLHTYTVTVREGEREHTFSVYGPHRHPDGRYWNVIAPLAELAERLGPPEEFILTMRVEGGLSTTEYALYTVLVQSRSAYLLIEKKERDGPAEVYEWELPFPAARQLYVDVAEGGIWELGDSRAAEHIITDIPTYTFTLETGDRRHSFSVYAPSLDPDPRYGAVFRTVQAFVE